MQISTVTEKSFDFEIEIAQNIIFFLVVLFCFGSKKLKRHPCFASPSLFLFTLGGIAPQTNFVTVCAFF